MTPCPIGWFDIFLFTNSFHHQCRNSMSVNTRVRFEEKRERENKQQCFFFSLEAERTFLFGFFFSVCQKLCVNACLIDRNGNALEMVENKKICITKNGIRKRNNNTNKLQFWQTNLTISIASNTICKTDRKYANTMLN